jgi:hypothetical protein
MTLVLAALVLLCAGGSARTEATTATPSTSGARSLQGSWEGAVVGHESAGKVTITFRGNSLHFQGLNADQWYDATFTLREGTRPRQLHATITGCEAPSCVGTAVGAIFEIEDGTLSLAGLKNEGPQAFEGNTIFHYRFRKVAPLPTEGGAPRVF